MSVEQRATAFGLPAFLYFLGLVAASLFIATLAMPSPAYGSAAFDLGAMLSFTIAAWTLRRERVDGAAALLQERETCARREERSQSALSAARVGVWSWNIPQNHIESDDGAATLFGLPADQFPRALEGFAELILPEDRERVQQQIDTAVRHGTPYATEFRVVWPDASIHSLFARGRAYYDEAKLPEKLTGAVWDVTERRVAEHALRETTKRLVAEAKFRELLESAPDAVVVVNRRGTIILVNTQMELMFGYKREELLGETLETLVPVSARAHHPALRATFFTEHRMRLKSAGLNIFAVRKDGTEFPVEISLSPLETEDGMLVSASIRDITERKRGEQQIMELNRRLETAAATADAANRAKSTFLSTMSHEIRTPMNAILGYAQLMARDPSLNPEAKSNLKIIGRSGEYLLALINDVLDMSKIEAGRTEIDPTTFGLVNLLDDLAAMFRLRAESKALNFQMRLDGETVPAIIADEGKLRQALINLVGNAIKFTAQGSVHLQVTLSRAPDDKLWLKADIQDTGPGISHADQKKLFEPFSQVRRGLHTQEGTGLGLAITRSFARLMGGDVSVISTPGQGSVFSFEIPVEVDSEAVTANSREPRRVARLLPGTAVPTILIVDDQFENRDWLMKLLGTVGFLVEEAENGEVAIRKWAAGNLKFIVMDRHMPVLDGLEATRRIKADPRGRDTAIVVLSASVMDEDRRSVFDSGADDFLTKPCHQDELFEKIRAHFNLTYEYADSPAAAPSAPRAIDPSRVARLPRDLIENLRNATLTGDKPLMNNLLLALGNAGDPESAAALKDLADRYEYDILTDLLARASAPTILEST